VRPELRRAAPIAAVLACFALTALVVPVMTPAAIGDDWVYAISVERLVRTGQLEILDLSVVTLVFQVFWGSLFALIFGPGFGILRLSTFVAVMVGGLACYGIARELAVDRAKSVFAAAAYLFNPLSFVLSYTFMTDPHFTALMTVSTFGYLRGLRSHPVDRPALLLGAGFAALAFLVRQQGVLIPLAVIAALVFQRRLRLDRQSFTTFLGITAIPVIVVVLYYSWLSFVHGLPEQQGMFAAKMTGAGLDSSVELVARLTFVEAMYLGLFTLPVVVAALPALWRVVGRLRPVGWALCGAWTVMLAAGIRHFDSLGFNLPPMPRMPYIPQYLSPTGLGPADLAGRRPWLVSWQMLDLLTAVCAISSLLIVCLVVARLMRSDPMDDSRSAAGIVLCVFAGQVAGVWPPSFHFRDWIISVDRYLLPLLPLAICLGVWALRGLPWSRTGAWLVLAGIAIISIAGTRDFLVYQGEMWNISRRTYAMGVPLTQIDGGAAWDGYYLYEYSIAAGLDQQTPSGPWWTDLFGPATTSDYVVAASPLQGYDVIEQQPVSSWLAGQSPSLFLLRRDDFNGPPFSP
jgi:4-amino-4-deoxy-L-arabinose transferase-like glycosyltransferase